MAMSQSPIQSCRSLQALYRQLCMGDWAMSENTVLVSFNQTCLPLFVKNRKMLEKKIVRLFFLSQNAILNTETTHIVNGT